MTIIGELLPCPFCGKPPRTCADDSYGAARVWCPDDNECTGHPEAWAILANGETLAVAIEHWNTRSPDVVTVMREALKRARWRCEGVHTQPADQVLADVAEILDVALKGKETMTNQELAAFDAGCGQRSVSHRHENPYSVETHPAEHAAWERGWQETDAELSAGND